MITLDGYNFSEIVHGSTVIRRGAGLGLAPITLIEHSGGDPVERRRCAQHAYELASRSDNSWAERPIGTVEINGSLAVVFVGRPVWTLDTLLGRPMDPSSFLALAIPIAEAVRQMHDAGVMHCALSPWNILVGMDKGVRLTGFKHASTLESVSSDTVVELIGKDLAYIAPEQTGRMSRPVDRRCDLYSIGVIFYEMLTGERPFTAHDPMGWAHAHLAHIPATPKDRRPQSPTVLSTIVMRLLSKGADDRYQSAKALVADLRRADEEWQARGHRSSFSIAHQVASGWSGSTQLHERSVEQATLRSTLSKLAVDQKFGMIAISGPSGFGKTALVRELQPHIGTIQGRFGVGKFDALRRDRPYDAISQALGSVFRSLLLHPSGATETAVAELRESLGVDVSSVARILPDLGQLLGHVRDTPPLPGDPEIRLHNALLRLLDHLAGLSPIVLFLDDLQWADDANARFLQRLVARGGVSNLLLITTFRDEPSTNRADLDALLSAAENNLPNFVRVRLAPLSLLGTTALIGTFVRDEKGVLRLAQHVHQATGGNPLHALQLLENLVRAGILVRSSDGSWIYNDAALTEKAHPEDLFNLLNAKLSQLPRSTQDFLCRLACLGQSIDRLFVAPLIPPNQEVDEIIAPALKAGVLTAQSNRIEFAHDRLQEAAYALHRPDHIAQLHLEIGRALLNHAAPDTPDEVSGAALDQISRCYWLLSAEEKEPVTHRLIEGAQAARRTSAFASAIELLKVGELILGELRWRLHRDLAFLLDLERAECTLLAGEPNEAIQFLTELSMRPLECSERRKVALLKVKTLVGLDRYAEAITVGLSSLQREGVHFLHSPSASDVDIEYLRLQDLLQRRSLESLTAAPLLADEAILFHTGMLAELIPAALSLHEDLFALILLRIANITLEHGNSPTGCFVFTIMNMVVGFRYGDFEAGRRFGDIAMILVEQPALQALRARVFCCFGALVHPWWGHVRGGISLAEQAVEIATQMGDVVFAAYSRDNLQTLRYVSGTSLATIEQEAVSALTFAQRAGIAHAATFQVQVARARALQGSARVFGSLDGRNFNEQEYENVLDGQAGLGMAEFRYLTFKLEARLQAGRIDEALECVHRAMPLQWTCASFFDTAEFYLYAGLAAADALRLPGREDDNALRQQLELSGEKLRTWAKNSPANFACRAALLEAELSSANGDFDNAFRHFDLAMEHARQHGFIQVEAIAAERAGRTYMARASIPAAEAYMRLAHRAYLSWGARGKATELERRWPSLIGEVRPTPHPVPMALDGIDQTALLTSLQAVASEVDPEALVSKLMNVTLSGACATRAVLFLLHQGTLRVAAHAELSEGAVTTRYSEIEPLSDWVGTVVERVREQGTREMINDVAASDVSGEDSNQLPRSVLCLPLIRQSALTGVLYLENTVAAYAFSEQYTWTLEVIAAQAAAAIEVARLYDGLLKENRERQIAENSLRRSEAWLAAGQSLAKTGSWRWNLRTNTVEWSAQQFLIFGLEPNSVAPSPELLISFIHPDDRATCIELLEQARRTGESFSHGYRIVRPDGEIRFLHGVGTADVNGGPSEMIGTVMDITDRKLAEEAVRATQSELAHAARLTMVGELANSIIHEINQPLTATVAGAQAARRWLEREVPDLGRARGSITAVIRDTKRVAETVAGLRALARRGELEKASVDLDSAIDEVLAVLGPELTKRRIQLVRTGSSGQPPVWAQRIQIQQVLINLLRNAMEAMTDENSMRKQIVLGLERDQDAIHITVADTGPGISPDLTDSIFNPLVTSKSDGMGMGLAISRSIVEAHGSRLVLQPSSIGAFFTFSLPVVGASSEASANISVAELASSSRQGPEVHDVQRLLL